MEAFGPCKQQQLSFAKGFVQNQEQKQLPVLQAFKADIISRFAKASPSSLLFGETVMVKSREDVLAQTLVLSNESVKEEVLILKSQQQKALQIAEYLMGQNQQLNSKLKQRRTDFDRSVDSLARLQALERSDLQRKCSLIRQQNQVLVQSLRECGGFRQQFHTVEELVQARLEEKEQDERQLRRLIEGSSQRTGRLLAELPGLQEQTIAAEDEQTRLQTAMKEFAQREKSAAEELAMLKRDNETSHSRLDFAERRVESEAEELRIGIAVLREQEISLSLDLERMAARRETAGANCSQLRDSNRRYQDQLARVLAQSKELRDKVAVLNERGKRANLERESAQDEVDRLRSEVGAVREESELRLRVAEEEKEKAARESRAIVEQTEKSIALMKQLMADAISKRQAEIQRLRQPN